MLDELRRVALFTSGVAELTRHQAERIVRDFVKNGDVRRQQASSVVAQLLDSSKVARTELVKLVRSEIQNQIANLGLVTSRDIERLERRVGRLESAAKKKTTATRSSTPRTRSTSSRSTGSGSSTRSNPPPKTST